MRKRRAGDAISGAVDGKKMMISDSTIIYHYTDIKGLFGIFQDQTLWATDFRYLNDGMELRVLSEYCKKRLKERSDILVKKNDILKRIDELDKVREKIFHENPKSPQCFIVSFCRNKDLLSQWRGYGPDGGYAIGFDVSILLDLLNKELRGGCFLYGHLDEVVYNDDSMTAAFQSRVDLIIGDLCIFDTYDKQKKAEVASRYFANLPFLKHEGFREEQEYRLVLVSNPESNLKEIKYRCRSGLIIPYMEFFKSKNNKKMLPILNVIVGPSVNGEMRKQSIQSMLAQKGFNPQMVKLSTISYVPK
jgi:hypothetical protein